MLVSLICSLLICLVAGCWFDISWVVAPSLLPASTHLCGFNVNYSLSSLFCCIENVFKWGWCLVEAQLLLLAVLVVVVLNCDLRVV
ncbi:putative olfactory receptor 52D1-like [Sesbania bispinosa]|nr:putative olfactory receptor 52D1-like [Sesbania bispinosa]